jgi:hypothetical protein
MEPCLSPSLCCAVLCRAVPCRAVQLCNQSIVRLVMLQICISRRRRRQHARRLTLRYSWSPQSCVAATVNVYLAVLSYIVRHYTQPLITTLAPSFPRIPLSCGFGLCPLPLFLLKKPNMPFGFADKSFASAGNVASCLASSDQLPVSPRMTCIPPVELAVREGWDGRPFRL